MEWDDHRLAGSLFGTWASLSLAAELQCTLCCVGVLCPGHMQVLVSGVRMPLMSASQSMVL